jgi:serine protease inhibitor
LIKTEDVSFEGFSGKIDLCGKLNKLADEKTHGLIKEFVRPDQLDDLIKFVITNVIYFKDDWLNELDETSSEYNFYGSKQTVSRKFLGRHDHLAYYEDAQVQIVELPFKNSAATCRIYVPRESLFGLVDGLQTTLNKGSLCKKDGIKVDFYCPSFKVETTIDNLVQLTRDQGITKVFSPSKDWSFLDFSKLDSAAVVWIETIKQKAVFDFTKKGVEAAAMTGMFLFCSGCFMVPEEKVTIRANKPFLFTLNHGDEVIFIGVINNVEGSSKVIREFNQEKFNFILDNPLGVTGIKHFNLRPLVGGLK